MNPVHYVWKKDSERLEPVYERPANRSHRIWVFFSSVFAFVCLVVAILAVPPEVYWPAVIESNTISEFRIISESLDKKMGEFELKFEFLEKKISPLDQFHYLEEKIIKRILEVDQRIASSRVENLNPGFLDRLSTAKLGPMDLFSCLNERTLVVEDLNASFYYLVKEDFSFDMLIFVLPRVN